MVNLGIDIDKLEKMASRYNLSGKKVDGALNQYLTSVSIKTQYEIKRNEAPKDQGAYAGGIYYEVDTANKVAEVKSNKNYAASIEYGQKPGHMPPPIALEGWVKRHWDGFELAKRAPYQFKEGSGRKARSMFLLTKNGRYRKAAIVKFRKGAYARKRTVKEMAWALAKHIEMHGTKPNPVFQRTEAKLQIFYRLTAENIFQQLIKSL